jgi:hypothetical protein
MSDNGHHDGIHPFPAGMESREIETNGAKIHCASAGMARRSSCCTASAQRATCGVSVLMDDTVRVRIDERIG